MPPMFWPLPASFLTGASAAAGIAAINSLGNLSGFAGPYAMGYLKDLTGNFTAGLLLLTGCALLGAIVVSLLPIDVRREQASGEAVMASATRLLAAAAASDVVLARAKAKRFMASTLLGNFAERG